MFMGGKLKIGVACGGTGGHIFPGLATANVLVDRGHDVTLWLAGKDIEHDAVKNWTGKIVTIPSEGFQFGVSMRSLLTFKKLYQARAVSLLARKAHTVAVSFDKSRFYLKHSNIETTGMPLRKNLQQSSAVGQRDWDPNEPLRILIVGGSRGAQVLNEVVPHAIAAAVGKGVVVEVEHVAGLQETDEIVRIYDEAGIKARVHHFVQDMENLYLKADLAICRSGAATCAELAAFAVPALFIPYPFAVRDHQMSNARVLQDFGAADVVAQEDLTATWLCDYLVNVFQKPERLDRMTAAMKKRAQTDAADRLADLLERVAGA